VLRGGATLDPVDDPRRQGAEFLGTHLGRRPRRTETAKEKVIEHEVALVSGTVDDNFGLAPVKVVMPIVEKQKRRGQSATAVGSIIFGLGFNILLFIAHRCC
jgi:hypothetical protein